MEIKDIIFIFMIIVIASLGAYNTYTLFKFQKTHEDILKEDETTNATYIKNFNDIQKVNSAINTKIDSMRSNVRNNSDELQQNSVLIQSNQSLISRNQEDIGIISNDIFDINSNINIIQNASTDVNKMYDDYVNNNINFSSLTEIQSHYSNSKYLFDDYTKSKINFSEIQSHYSNSKALFDDYTKSKINFIDVHNLYDNVDKMVTDYNENDINFSNMSKLQSDFNTLHTEFNSHSNLFNDYPNIKTMLDDYQETGINFSTITDHHDMYSDDYSNLKSGIFNDYKTSEIDFQRTQERISSIPDGFSFTHIHRLLSSYYDNENDLSHYINGIEQIAIGNSGDINENASNIRNNTSNIDYIQLDIM